MPDTKKEMKGKHIPGVCTKDRAVSGPLPREDLISAWPKKTPKMFIGLCTLLKAMWLLINVLLGLHVLFSKLVETRKVLARVHFPKLRVGSPWP